MRNAGYQYAIDLECNWIVVSNYRGIRLYHKSRSIQCYEPQHVTPSPSARGASPK